MIQVLMVEDSKFSKDGISHTIEESENYHIIAVLENAANAKLACLTNNVDLILMDVCTADDESGLKAAAEIKKQNPEIKIIVMTSMPEYSFIERAQEAGCEGFWYKEFGDTSLLEVCDRVIAGQVVYPKETPEIKIGLVKSSEITPREYDVLRELVKGKQYTDISQKLGVSLNTVKFHIRSILQKTGFNSSLELVAEIVGKRLVLPKF